MSWAATSALPLAAVAASSLVAIWWYSALLLARDEGLMTFGYDQAFFQQLVWNLDHGRGLVSSFMAGSFLGLHFEPLLVVAAAVEQVWPDPRALSLLAAISIAALGPAAFLFVRSLTGKAAPAAALAAPLPFWPALQEAARAGFHPEYLGVGLALSAGWAALAGRPRLTWTLALLALGAKEEQAYDVLVIGLAVASRPAARRLGLQLVGLAVAWGGLVVGLVMPLLRAGRHVDTDSYYSWLPHASPFAALHALAAPGGWLAFLVMLACAAGLPVLRPGWLGLAAPPLLADLLSAHDPQPLLHLQYALPLVVPLLVAAGKAAPALAGLRPAAVLVIPPALAAVALGSMPPALTANPIPFQQSPSLARLQACALTLPADAPVAADDTLLAPLASRSGVRELTDALASDYLVVDREARLPGYVARADRERVIANGGGAVLCDDGRFVVMGPSLR